MISLRHANVVKLAGWSARQMRTGAHLNLLTTAIIQMGTTVNMEFLENALKQTSYILEQESISLQWLQDDLHHRFKEIDYSAAFRNVKPFLQTGSEVPKFCSADFLCDTASRIQEADYKQI